MRKRRYSKCDGLNTCVPGFEEVEPLSSLQTYRWLVFMSLCAPE